jgi:hypothetical protein
VRAWSQTGYARLSDFYRHNSVALVRGLVTDLRRKTVGTVVKTVSLSSFEGVPVAVMDCFRVWRTLVRY